MGKYVSEVLNNFLTNDHNTNDLTERLSKIGTELEWQLQLSQGRNKRITESFEDSKLHGRRITRCGSSGWNHATKESIFVGIDIDSKSNHAEGLTWRQLRQVRQTLKDIPYVELRRSTNSGYHVYVWLTEGVKCESRKDHAAVANYVASKLPISFDWLDCKGSILWCAANGRSPKGFQLLKAATENFNPQGWENFKAQQNHRQKLSDDHKKAPITREHTRVLDLLKGHFTYDHDKNLFRIHTASLKKIHANPDNKIIGEFETNSPGSNLQTFNAFMFPGPAGSFRVVRYGNGVKEHESWTHGDQWVSTMFNQVDVDAYDFFLRDTPFRCVSDTPGKAWLEYRTKEGSYIQDNRRGIEKQAMATLNIDKATAEAFVCELKQHIHHLITVPFAAEKPAQDQINLTKSFTVEPTPGDFPNIKKVFAHIGEALNKAVRTCEDCREIGILTGEQYLYQWLVTLVKRPERPLPCLMLYSRTQDSGGKSKFLEALTCFMNIAMNGVCWVANNEVQGRFNSFLDGKALLILDEVNFADDANKFKQLFAPTRVSEGKGVNCKVQNQYLHVAVGTNDLKALPLDEDDRRTVCIEAPYLRNEDKDDDISRKIKAEASAFLHWIQDQEVCQRRGRLHLPVLNTELKSRIIETLHPDTNWRRKAVQNFVSYVDSNGEILMTPGELHNIANTQTKGKFTACLRSVLTECQEQGLNVEGPIKKYSKSRRKTCNHYRIFKGKNNEKQNPRIPIYDPGTGLPSYGNDQTHNPQTGG